MTDPRDLREQPLDHALDRRRAGTATPDDDALIADWIAADPARADLRATIPAIAAGEVHVSLAETNAAWDIVAARMQGDGARPITSAHSVRPAPERSSATCSWMLRVAALLVVIAGTAAIRTLRSPSLHEVIAPRGQRISTTLPDGSTLTLAAGSRARWTREFGTTERTVLLDGEGFVSVVHDATRPFRVRARHSLIEDIGTRFAIRAWAELAAVGILVEEGRVSVRDTIVTPQSQVTELRAGERGQLPVGGSIVVSEFPLTALAWLDGTLQFDNAPLTEALPVIERWYNVTITVDPSLTRRRLSARFEAQPISQLLVPLGLALDATVTQSGPSITIVPR